MKPRYTHDCHRCTFIACIVSFGRVIDLYRSCSKLEGGFIARFSSEGGDYATVHAPTSLLTQTLQGERLTTTDFLTCEAVEKQTHPLNEGNKP